MKNIFTCLFMALAALQVSAAELGMPAPALNVTEWVKGKAVDLNEGKGKNIYVVEFWATWCPPCRASIPHLTELQKKFKDKGVIVIGVSDETVAEVKPFVTKMGTKMEYTVAVDKNDKTSAAYMGAFGVGGIPHAFVVDKTGAIVWHGHPMGGLDKAIEAVLEGKTPKPGKS
jgi:thiol-disulfide isomerase/thioredoxin